MKYSELRQTIRTWLGNQIRIDKWSVETPSQVVRVINNVAYPANVALESPVKDVYVSDSTFVNGYRSIHCVLPYAIQYRFSHQLKIDDLPQSPITALYFNVIADWLLKGTKLSEDILRTGTTDIVESPIIVSRMGDASSDWLITLLFEFEVDAFFDPEKVPSIQPDDFGQPDLPDSIPLVLNWGLWRSSQGSLGDQNNSFLDSEIP